MKKASAPRRHLPTSPFEAPAAPAAKSFAPGDRVTHDRYGLGTVLSAEDGVAMHVDFGSRHVRVTAPYDHMEKL
ncbi:hypothetical protein [Streptomyces synnematoformans]|uniref:ATP-binding protein n=1 Tax=Streptomyces synnematoformans TaxID=415721 RepID=A0ABP4KE82_9ACTN